MGRSHFAMGSGSRGCRQEADSRRIWLSDEGWVGFRGSELRQPLGPAAGGLTDIGRLRFHSFNEAGNFEVAQLLGVHPINTHGG
jgi:hypothetical protein